MRDGKGMNSQFTERPFFVVHELPSGSPAGTNQYQELGPEIAEYSQPQHLICRCRCSTLVAR